MGTSKKELNNFLYCFNTIISQGVRSCDRFELGAMQAWSDFDGYSCYIGYKDLTLTLLFHGRYSFYYQDKSTYKDFLRKVNSLSLQKVAANE